MNPRQPTTTSATRRAALLVVSLLAAVSLVACGGSSGTGAASSPTQEDSSGPSVTGALTVMAAASLQEAFEEIGAMVEEDSSGLSITFDFQGSQDLVASLAQGAPADVLATANTSTMDDAASQGLVGEPTEFATNVLTLIVPEGNPAGVTGLDSSLEGADLVVCAPEVPCGEATVELAEALGVTLDPVSQEQKVTDVRGKVASGEAEAGIVYTTDATAATGVEQVDIPDGGVVNHYPVATTTEPANPQAAQAFIDAVTGEEGQAVLADYGFGEPSGSDDPDGAATAGPSPSVGESGSPRGSQPAVEQTTPVATTPAGQETSQ